MIEVVFIGTSDAFGSGGRRQSAYLVRCPDGAILLDCGASTSSGLEELGVSRSQVDAIVVSHFHGDHFGGLPLFLVASRYVDERSRPLIVAGPQGIEARVRALCLASGHPVPEDLGYPLRFVELEPGVEAEAGPFTVESFETFHSPDAAPHGLLVRDGSRCIAYSGDTGWFDELPDCVGSADLFICECTLEQQTYAYHLSLEELRAHRRHFRCGRIVLTHLGPEMRARTDVGDFEVADDGMTVKL